jgi:hypothetical protein
MAGLEAATAKKLAPARIHSSSTDHVLLRRPKFLISICTPFLVSMSTFFGGDHSGCTHLVIYDFSLSSYGRPGSKKPVHSS